jgi:hypothetical protein
MLGRRMRMRWHANRRVKGFLSQSLRAFLLIFGGLPVWGAAPLDSVRMVASASAGQFSRVAQPLRVARCFLLGLPPKLQCCQLPSCCSISAGMPWNTTLPGSRARPCYARSTSNPRD